MPHYLQPLVNMSYLRHLQDATAPTVTFEPDINKTPHLLAETAFYTVTVTCKPVA